MVPFTVRAHMSTPPVADNPIMLDGVLLWCVGAKMAATVGSVTPKAVYDAGLPLAKIERGEAWWWAASQHVAIGATARRWKHRRAPIDLMRNYTDARSILIVGGEDKSLRVPIFYRPEDRVLTFHGVGDPELVGDLLSYCPGVGKYTTDGYGAVERWEVVTDPSAPALSEYATNPHLRHLPFTGHAKGCRRWSIPLRPPYHHRDFAVDCIQSVVPRA